VCFPPLAAAEACSTKLLGTGLAASLISAQYLHVVHLRQHIQDVRTHVANAHVECFSHLRVCIEPDWQELGGDKQTATAALVRLAEWLGCRDRQCALLPGCEAVCLARGADAILAAVEAAGGAMALAGADEDAAIRLCQGLMQAVGDVRRSWLPNDMRRRVEGTFSGFGTAFLLTAAAAQLRKGSPGSPQLACTAARLTLTVLQQLDHPANELQRQQMPAMSHEVG
jgi:hypothetical protein